MIAMPVATTAAVNTAWRGSRRWTTSSVTTPIAAPTPSAVISRPNADGAAAAARRSRTADRAARSCPPPIKPPASPIITPRTSGLERMNLRPSMMSRQVCATGTRLTAPRSLSSSRSREMSSAETRNVERVDPDRRATPAGRGTGRDAWKPPSHFATPARLAKKTAPSGNVPNAATSPSEFADASCSGSFTMFGTRRVLGRTPQQRQHLDQERQHDEARAGCPRTAAERAARRGRCRT